MSSLAESLKNIYYSIQKKDTFVFTLSLLPNIFIDLFYQQRIQFLRKRTKSMLGLGVVTIAACCGYFAYEDYRTPEVSDLLLANVEALGQREDNEGGCPGVPVFSTSGIMDAEVSERVHKGNGKDVITVFKVKKCVAYGSGDLEGNNSMYFGLEYARSSEVSCNGQHYSLDL